MFEKPFDNTIKIRSDYIKKIDAIIEIYVTKLKNNINKEKK